MYANIGKYFGKMYTSPRHMLPMLPSMGVGPLHELAAELMAQSSQLEASVHPLTREPIEGLVRQMNSYYSNLIEGHHTRPRDIERALDGAFARDSKTRDLQRLALAHVKTSQWLCDRLAGGAPVCSVELLLGIHRSFYAQLPASLRRYTDPNGTAHELVGGQLRELDVQVGRHVAPAHGSLDELLAAFCAAYDPAPLGPLERVVAAAASHHRLAWIHPVADGNGRLARLFTDGYLRAVGLGSGGLWSISRGFARTRDEYLSRLAAADAPREGDLDGRGNLSDRKLGQWVGYFLRTAIDQVEFMREQLQLDRLAERIDDYVQRGGGELGLRPEAAHVLVEAAGRGSVPRGQVARISGLGDRTARTLIRQLTEAGLVRSETPKGPLRLAVPMDAASWWFPRLFPAGA